MKRLAALFVVAIILVTSLVFPPMPVNLIAAEEQLSFIVRIDLLTMGTKMVRTNTTVEQVIIELQDTKELPLVYKGDSTRQIIDGETLNLKSLRVRHETQSISIPYNVYKNHTCSVWEGQRRVRQEGLPGIRNVTTEITYIGGVEQSREVVEESMLLQPVNAIVDVGTGRLGALTDVTSPYFHYVRRVRMEATAYTAGFGCTGKRPGDPGYRITASGRRVEHGIVAVDRRVIPLGTRLYVEGYGFAIAADVGGAIRGYRIDLFMESLQDALRFGRRDLYVWILE